MLGVGERCRLGFEQVEGFEGAVAREAAEEPLAADEVVNEAARFGGGGVVELIILVDEALEVGELLVGKEEGFGVEAGFEGVQGRGGLACDRGGAGGFLRVTAVGFDLSKGRHKIAPGRDRQGCLSYFDDKGRILGNRR